MRIPLSKPDITDAEKTAVMRVLESGRLALGPETEAFEKALAGITGRKLAIAVSSGTAALHLSLIAADIGKGDEVITSPFSFVASANAIMYVGARIVFADIEEETLCLDPAKADSVITEKTKAILPVHIFGALADMDAFCSMAEKHSLKIIEDACEAIGATRGNHKAGGSGDFAVFGFYPNKQITTGEGGAVVTDDPDAAVKIRSLRNQGRAGAGTGEMLEHVRLGYNYRINELSSALGRAQLERLNEILENRTRVADLYSERLRNLADIRLLNPVPGGSRSWFVYVIMLKDPSRREALSSHLSRSEIDSRTYFPPIHFFDHIRNHGGFSKGQFPVTERVAESTLALPFYTTMTDKEVDYVCDKVAAFLS
ncbi:MAG: DegT/DnrJ/EryC1/StrS family aminotransferase [Planctomycetota bacterium]|nr:MAG: DegT/DnrJ/EryC1/StrS family aminotransferase [Planctomycetota bacterium]